MVVRKRVAKKVNGTTKSAPKKAPAKVVTVRVQFDVMVSVGEADERSFEEFRDDMVVTLKEKVGAKNVTPMSGYYLVDGKVCLPDDYDPETRDFKKGAHPPLWAMGPDEQKIVQRIEREKNRPAIARQPTNLRTSTETDEYHELLKKDPDAAAERRRASTKKVLDDLNENTEWGRQRKADLEAAEVEDIEDEDDIEEYEDEPEDDEIEDIEDEWEEGDEFDEDAADEVVKTSSSSVLDRLRANKKKLAAKR